MYFVAVADLDGTRVARRFGLVTSSYSGSGEKG